MNIKVNVALAMILGVSIGDSIGVARTSYLTTPVMHTYQRIIAKLTTQLEEGTLSTPEPDEPSLPEPNSTVDG